MMVGAKTCRWMVRGLMMVGAKDLLLVGATTSTAGGAKTLPMSVRGR